MTIGIAACCSYKEKPAIVLCCDWQGTSYSGKAEYLRKMRGISDHAQAVIAGDVSDADELLAGCYAAAAAFAAKQHDADNMDLNVSAYMAELRQIVQKRRTAIVDHHLRMTIGMSADGFWKNGKQALLDLEHQAVLEGIKEIDLNCYVILATLKPGADEGTIVTVDPHGKVSWADTFSTIGTGAIIAMGVMSQFRFGATVQLEDCIFRVLMAKRASQADPHVGTRTTLEVLLPNGPHTLSHDATNLYEEAVDGAYECPKLDLPQTFLVKSK